MSRRAERSGATVLLVGPCDPSCGEYTFLSPPLGVWRLAGVLEQAGHRVEVVDPNLAEGPAGDAVAEAIARLEPDVIGFSTTGMTLRHDLGLARLARRLAPGALHVAGGIEATFNPERVLDLGGFDLGVLGEGERPLLEIAARVAAGAPVRGVRGTFFRGPDGGLVRLPQPALGRDELRDAVFATPYERMPYRRYWRRLEERYRVGALPHKADREAGLAEIRSVRLMTLNYCPMGCTFCSSTAFLNEAQGATARIARLDAGECLSMLRRIVAAFPDVRTVIFQDDIFAFTSDPRVLPLCAGISAAKAAGELPAGLQFISTNRIDAMTPERLAAMRRAGFRVLGFGIESFSQNVLQELNKGAIHRHIEPVLDTALGLGITPFLDLILTSPRGTVADLAENVRSAFRWMERGCEVGMYPYVIPFSGAPLARDPALAPHTIRARQRIDGSRDGFEQAVKIPPIDPTTRRAILEIEAGFSERLAWLEERVAHLPSRVRSLLWVLSALPVLDALGEPVPARGDVLRALGARLPQVRSEDVAELVALLAPADCAPWLTEVAV